VAELRQKIDSIIQQRDLSEETRRILSEQLEPMVRRLDALEGATQKASLCSPGDNGQLLAKVFYGCRADA